MTTETVPGAGRPADESDASIDELAVTTIRTLAMDAVQAANSGHPGTPMAMAPVAYTLWQHFLRFDPDDPIWPDRDRFVLSIGHASTLLYALLHLAGVKAVNPAYERLGELSVPLDDIKRFRQIDSRCPGHPEYRWTSGVETTTGPLGQGVATSVGMAIAGEWQAAHFNRPGFELFDYDVYALCGDGDMMEGISSEAASLAGHLGLANLCWIYDNNHITIEGSTSLAFSDDVATRFIGYGWNVTRVGDANDREMLAPRVRDVQERVRAADADHRRQPHRLRRADQAGHARRRTASRSATRRSASPRQAYGWPEDAQFLVPDGVREHFAANLGERGRQLREAWMEHFGRYREEHPDLADQLLRMQRRELPDGWDADIPEFPPDDEGPGQPRGLGQGAQRDRQAPPVAARRRRRPRAVDQDRPDVRGRRRVRAATTATAATCTSACASTRWARRSTGSRCRSCARSAPAS